MANNLFISYDLNQEQSSSGYPVLIEKIKSLGNWAHIQKSFWYVSSNLDSESTANYLRNYIDNNDALIVIDATNNNAYWLNLQSELENQIQNNWPR